MILGRLGVGVVANLLAFAHLSPADAQTAEVDASAARPSLAADMRDPSPVPRETADASKKNTGESDADESVLFATDMPIWLSLSLAGLAALGTYFLAPHITRRIEIGKARSAHVVAAINSINTVVIELNKRIRKFIASFRGEPKTSDQARSDILDMVTELQWRLIDLKVILKGREDHIALDQLGEKIETLRKGVASFRDGAKQDILLELVAAVSEKLKGILDRLYREAKLK